MNRRAVFQLVSYLTLVIGLAMIGCAGISSYYAESVAVRYSFLFAGIGGCFCLVVTLVNAWTGESIAARWLLGL